MISITSHFCSDDPGDEITGGFITYTGEMLEGVPCGNGVAKRADAPDYSWKGTFFNSKIHGLSTYY